MKMAVTFVIVVIGLEFFIHFFGPIQTGFKGTVLFGLCLTLCIGIAELAVWAFSKNRK